jgi:hypothetical protein
MTAGAAYETAPAEQLLALIDLVELLLRKDNLVA